jgi:malate dehydrogenase (oxaloacetate-decarboxylating)(NADP+)
VLRAVQVVIEEKFARPILIGRPEIIERRLEKAKLRIRPGKDFDIVNPESDERYRECWQAYHKLMVRRGVTPGIAKDALRRKPTVIGAMLLKLGYADGLICGMTGQYSHHLGVVNNIIGKRNGVNTMAAMNYLMLPGRSLFICDTHVNENPSAQEIAEMTLMAAEQVRRFGMQPKVALLSHSNFGSSGSEAARKMAVAAGLVGALSGGELEVDGEMHGDSALDEGIRRSANPDSPLKGEANLLIMPNIDAANISYNLIKMTAGEGVTIGPVLLGVARPVHVMTATATVRRVVNMTALAVVESMER